MKHVVIYILEIMTIPNFLHLYMFCLWHSINYVVYHQLMGCSCDKVTLISDIIDKDKNSSLLCANSSVANTAKIVLNFIISKVKKTLSFTFLLLTQIT